MGPAIQIRAADYATESISVDWHEDIVIHDNVFMNLGRDAVIWGQSSGKGMKFYNNIVVNTGANPASDRAGLIIQDGSFDTSEPSLDLEIYNNVFYGQDAGHYMLRLDRAGNLKIKNNIFMAVNSGEVYWEDQGMNLSAITASNNFWFGSSQAVPTWDTNPIPSDPNFVDPTNPARNFHLLPDSPAIDAGTAVSVSRDFDGILRPQGIAFDMGAYEYNQNTPPPPPDTTPPFVPTGLTVN